MGSQTILDLIASTMVFGSLLLMMLRINVTQSETIQMYQGDLLVQQNLVEVTVDGRVTLASLRSSGPTGGTVTITNSLMMNADPRTDVTSDDMLGIISYGDITIADNSATRFDVQGTLYSYTGGLAVEHGTSRPAGTLGIYGGMMVEKSYATSNGASGSSRKGYNLSLHLDERFANDSPDCFPATGKYEILSWFE